MHPLTLHGFCSTQSVVSFTVVTQSTTLHVMRGKVVTKSTTLRVVSCMVVDSLFISHAVRSAFCNYHVTTKPWTAIQT